MNGFHREVEERRKASLVVLMMIPFAMWRSRQMVTVTAQVYVLEKMVDAYAQAFVTARQVV